LQGESTTSGSDLIKVKVTLRGWLRGGEQEPLREHQRRESECEPACKSDRRERSLGHQQAEYDRRRAELDWDPDTSGPTNRNGPSSNQRDQEQHDAAEEGDAGPGSQMVLAGSLDQKRNTGTHGRESHEQGQVRVGVDQGNGR
jgi:hypothetical protein